LRGGEKALATLWATGKPVASTTGTGGVWLSGSTNVLNSSWWNSNSIAYTVSGVSVTNAAASPRYVIEGGDGSSSDGYLNTKGYGLNTGLPQGQKGDIYYKITAGGVGVSPLSQAMVEETYRISLP